jgi:hypothetical protein
LQLDASYWCAAPTGVLHDAAPKPLPLAGPQSSGRPLLLLVLLLLVLLLLLLGALLHGGSDMGLEG